MRIAGRSPRYPFAAELPSSDDGSSWRRLWPQPGGPAGARIAMLWQYQAPSYATTLSVIRCANSGPLSGPISGKPSSLMNASTVGIVRSAARPAPAAGTAAGMVSRGHPPPTSGTHGRAGLGCSAFLQPQQGGQCERCGIIRKRHREVPRAR